VPPFLLPTEPIRSLDEYLAKEGFDPAFGARPLKRVIQKEIGDRLALALLEGQFAEGDTVTVDDAEGEIVLR
jgi:ATP-dependent Clp protease ATP-binding subunit ClpA